MTMTSESPTTEAPVLRATGMLMYLAMGIVFGIILTKSEVISWFRIQEMFRFQSFHMYGVIGSAVLVGAVSTLLIKRFDVKTLAGEPIVINDKPYQRGYNQWFGGTTFGLGWALTGACPGPLYALLGSGVSVIAVVLFCAALGALTYGYLKPALPH